MVTVNGQEWIIAGTTRRLRNALHDVNILRLVEQDGTAAIDALPSLTVGENTFDLPPFHIAERAVDSGIRGISICWSNEVFGCPWGDFQFFDRWSGGIWLGRTAPPDGIVDVTIQISYAQLCRYDSGRLTTRELLDAGLGLTGDLEDLMILGGTVELERELAVVPKDQCDAYLALADLVDHWVAHGIG